MREFLTSGLGVVALVFSILGLAFTSMGVAFTALVAPPAVGTVFSGAGVGFLAVGLGLGALRLKTLRRRAWLLEYGQEARGTIVAVAPNPHLRLNNRRPWIVRYHYEVLGREHEGSETLLDLPPEYVEGASVPVRYDPGRAEECVLVRKALGGA